MEGLGVALGLDEVWDDVLSQGVEWVDIAKEAGLVVGDVVDHLPEEGLISGA